MGLDHELGIIHMCAMCGSYFVLGIGHVDYTEYRGREGTKRMEDNYMKLQEKFENRKWTLNRCPTCIEVTTGQRYSTWLSSSDPAPVSPCRTVTFDEGEPPPLYVQDTPGRDRWTLAQGIGPKTLEMDHSHSGRLYKPALKAVIDGDCSQYKPATSASDHALMLQAVENAFAQALSDEIAAKLSDMLLRHTPVYVNWAQVSPVIEEIAISSQADAMNQMSFTYQPDEKAKKARDRELAMEDAQDLNLPFVDRDRSEAQ